MSIIWGVLKIIVQLYFQIFFNLNDHGPTKFTSTIELYSTPNRLSGICERNNHKVSEGKKSRKGKFKVTTLVSSSDYSTFYGRRFLLFWFSNFTLIQVLFIPFALTDQDEYARIARAPFEQWGFQLVSIHEAMQSEDPVMTVNKAQAIFIGGGNTFRLLKKLYDNNLVEPIRKRVLGR